MNDQSVPSEGASSSDLDALIARQRGLIETAQNEYARFSNTPAPARETALTLSTLIDKLMTLHQLR